MGYDVSGILFYGILVDAETEERIRRDSAYGFWDNYYQDQTGQPAAASCCTMGSYDELGTVTQTYVALSALHFEGHCRPPTEFDPEALLNIPGNAEQLLRNFCTVMGIPYSKPKWYLVGCYG